MHFRNLGDAQRHLGRAKEAAASYRRGREVAQAEITRNPRRGGVAFAAGMAERATGQIRSGAKFEMSQALAMEPENRSVIRDATFSYELMGLRDEAFTVLRRASRNLLEELNHQPDVT